MSKGDKSKYTAKQKRKAEHIEESYESRGVPEDEAEARAWATVNKQSGGGEKKGGSGQKKSETAKRADRKDSAHRAADSRKGRSPNQGHSPNKGHAGSGNKSGSTSLSSLTVSELRQRAARANIQGRSKMRKSELIQALS